MEKARADQWMKLRRFEVRMRLQVSERRGSDVRGGSLVIEDGPQCPRDDKSTGKIAISGGERVSGCGSLQEEAGKKVKSVSEAGHYTPEPETHRARKTKTLVQTPA